MARTAALGGWLKQSQHIGTRRSLEQQRGRRDVLMWKARGILWFITSVIFVLVDLQGMLSQFKHCTDRLRWQFKGMLRHDLRKWWLAVLLPSLTPISLFWTFWDPTWSSMRISRLQGRMFSVSGRNRYIVGYNGLSHDLFDKHLCQRCQMIVWLARLLTSVLIALEYTDQLTAYVTPHRSRCWYATALGIEVVVSTLCGLSM